MSFTTLTVSQKTFLESFLRGTNRTLTAAQARGHYGIANLRARICEMRKSGLVINRYATKTTRGSAYKVSRRDTNGSQGKIFSRTA